MTQRDEQNAVILHRVETVERTVKELRIFNKEEMDAFEAVVNLYRGVVALRTIGKGVALVLTGISATYLAVHNLTGWTIK